MKRPSRRMFLSGLSGITLAIPFLPSVAPRELWAQPSERPTFFVASRQANGMICGARIAFGGQDPDRWFPRETGALNAAVMGENADRATSELAEYADQLTLLKAVRSPSGVERGVDYGTDGHGYGGAVLLTARPPGNVGAADKDVHASGESIDSRIAREMNSGGYSEPLTLYAGEKSGYIQENVSFRTDGQWRAAEFSPENAFRRIMGLTGDVGGPDSTPDAAYEALRLRRKSINDAVREQITDLRGRVGLSRSDKQRLDQHLESVFDLEAGMAAASCVIPELSLGGLPNPDDYGAMVDGKNIVRVANLHADVIAMAFSCDITRAATLQIASGTSGALFYDGDTRMSHPWHHISHRVQSDDDSNRTPVPDATGLHHKIDRVHLRDIFKPLLDRLNERGILDSCIAVHTSEIHTGYDHARTQLPMAIVGTGNGYLRTGNYLNTDGVPLNKVLNTFGAACGVKNAAGAPLDDFGHESLDRGQYDAMT